MNATSTGMNATRNDREVTVPFAAQTAARLRYIVHFAEGGSGMRWFDAPLEEAALIVDGGNEYVVTRVDAPPSHESLGYAWVRMP